MIKAQFSLKDKKGVFKLNIFRHRLFWGGLFLKVILSFLFAGRFLREAFIPFVTYFWDSGFKDPYEFFMNSGMSDAFPYPPLMLYILGFLGGFLSDLSPFFIRIPLLCADIVILMVLSRLLKGNEKKVLLFYWLSPVLIYINYMHGQFDVIPIAFLLVSLYAIFRRELFISALILGLGIATKTNLVLVIPFYLLFVWHNNNNQRVKKIVILVFTTLFTFALMNLPFLNSKSFLEMVYDNYEQTKIWNASFSMLDSLNYFIIPSVYLVLLASAARFKNIGKDLFLIFIGFSFSVLLLFIPPQPGWYFWILPFFIYFTIREKKRTFFPIMALQIAFFLYFLFIKDSDYFYIYLFGDSTFTIYDFIAENQLGDPDIFASLAFTFLQTCLILNVYWIYKWGIKKNLEKKIKNRPFLVGIGGDSGVGKSTLSKLLTDLLGKENITRIQGDDMHRWERGHDKWDELTHLSPKANYLHEEIQQLKTLKEGRSILRKLYDHGVGQFTKPQKVFPNKIVIFEGLHPFYISAKRNLFDLKVFIEPEESLRLHWKISRDIKTRGYSKEKVLNQLELRKSDSDKYIRSQASFSDIKMSYYPIAEIKDIGNQEKVKIALKIELETNIDINNLIDKMTAHTTLKVAHDYDVDNQILDVSGTISRKEIEHLIYTIIGEYDELVENASYEKDLNGFLQLFCIYCILQKVKNQA